MTHFIDDAIPCRVTFPAHVHIGGGDPYPVKESSYEARYRNGVVLTPRTLEDGSQAWDSCFSVEGRPELGDRPIKRFMTNHGTYAARAGGGPVIIERLHPQPRQGPPTQSAPTADDILVQCSTPFGWYVWKTEGGLVTVDREDLRLALEAAYDPNMPDWPALISWDEESGFHVA